MMRLTKAQVRDYIDCEGLGYCISSYITADKIKDPKLRKLWAEANQSLKAVVEYLDESPKARSGDG